MTTMEESERQKKGFTWMEQQLGVCLPLTK